jgi:hypothetical protein
MPPVPLLLVVLVDVGPEPPSPSSATPLAQLKAMTTMASVAAAVAAHCVVMAFARLAAVVPPGAIRWLSPESLVGQGTVKAAGALRSAARLVEAEAKERRSRWAGEHRR